MGWIWFEGIKTTEPAKTASLLLDTHSQAGESCLGRGLPREGWSGEHFLPFKTLGLLGEVSQEQGPGCSTSSLMPAHSGLPPSPGASAGGGEAYSPSRSRAVASGPSHPAAHLPLPVSWPPGAGTENAPGPRAPNLRLSEVSPRPLSRLRRGKEESLTTTLLSLYELFHLQKLRPLEDPAPSSLACLPLDRACP